VPECLYSERRRGESNRIADRTAVVGDLKETLPGQVGVPGPLVRRGELKQDLGALASDAAGRVTFLDDLQGTEVMRAGIFMSQARGGLAGREERVFQGILLSLCSRGQEMRRDPRGRARPSLQRSPDRQVDRGSGRRGEAVEDGLAVEVVGEPQRRGAAMTPA
jgi:hypothetical protein